MPRLSSATSVLAIAVAAFALVSAPSAHAEDLTYTFSGTGSGSLNEDGVSIEFNSSTFTITATEDTANLQNFDIGYNGYTSITATFSNALFTETIDIDKFEVNENPFDGTPGQNYGSVFLFNPDVSGSVGIFNNNALIGYGMTTPLATVDGGADIGASGGSGFATSEGGTLFLDSVSALDFTVTGPATAATPEPPTLTLLATGLTGAGAMLRRRFRRA